jgi:glycine betaine/proline transport system substrate-binding protein
MTKKRWPKGLLIAGAVLSATFGLAACSSDKAADTTVAASAETTAAAGADSSAAASAETTATGSGETTVAAASDTTAAAAPAEVPAGEGIKLAVNPWTGSAVNANVAKIVLESKLATPTELVNIDESPTWPGLDAGDLDAVLEVWPSGHAKDFDTYITGKKTVADIGKLGPEAKIGWYVPTYMVEEHPELATVEGFAKPELAKLFATAETGDMGQFLMGDPSYVSYDEQIIANLKLPLKFVVAGSEAALITAIQQAVEAKKPILVQFWQPHWLQSKVALTQVKLPDYTDDCGKSAVAKDGKYACDYPVDLIYKAASTKLEGKNPRAHAFLSRFQLTTAQQNEIAAKVDSDKVAVDVAAKEWVAANETVVNGWLGAA